MNARRAEWHGNRAVATVAKVAYASRKKRLLQPEEQKGVEAVQG